MSEPLAQPWAAAPEPVPVPEPFGLPDPPALPGDAVPVGSLPPEALPPEVMPHQPLPHQPLPPDEPSAATLPPPGAPPRGYRARPRRRPAAPARRTARRPHAVLTAARLMWAQALLSGIGVLIVLSTRSELAHRIRVDTPTTTQATIDASVTVSVVLGSASLVLFAVLGVVVSHGRNWARIATWLLAGIGLVSGLGALGQPAPTATRVVGVMQLFVEVAVVVLLGLAPSTRYFTRRR